MIPPNFVIYYFKLSKLSIDKWLPGFGDFIAGVIPIFIDL